MTETPQRVPPLAAWGTTARVLRSVTGGHRASVWQVACDGVLYAARYSQRPSDALAWELDLLEYLARRAVGVPRILRTQQGERSRDGWVLLQWLPGSPPATPDDWRRVAAALEAVHALTRGWPQRPGFHSAHALLTASTGGDVALDRMPADVIERCRAAWAALPASTESVVHGDPGASNIVLTETGVGLLDWDEARVDSPLFDLGALPWAVGVAGSPEVRRAALAWEIATCWVTEPDYARRRLLELH